MSISAIVPVYNREKYIKKCIESIINQSAHVKEIIVVDDCSTDNSYKIVKEMAKTCGQIVLIKRRENGGVSSARNLGIERATGDYLVFVDSDDYVGKEYYKNLEYAIENYSTDVSIGGFTKVDDKGMHVKMDMHSFPEICQGREFTSIMHQVFKKRIFNSVYNKMYRRSIIKNNDILFDTSFSKSEDLRFNLEYFKKVNKVSFIDDSSYYYFQNPEGLSVSPRTVNHRLADNFKMIEYLKSRDSFYGENFNYFGKFYAKEFIARMKEIYLSDKPKNEKKADVMTMCENVLFLECLESFTSSNERRDLISYKIFKKKKYFLIKILLKKL